jgi:hypothetical protein
MTEYGLVGAQAPRAVIIDLLGLHDRAVALGGRSTRALFADPPDLIWMPHWDYTQMVRDLLDADALWVHYAFYPDAFTYGVALRLDGPRSAALERLFAERWAVAYPGIDRERYRARRAP